MSYCDANHRWPYISIDRMHHMTHSYPAHHGLQQLNVCRAQKYVSKENIDTLFRNDIRDAFYRLQ